MAVVDGGPVAPHVQAFADEIARRFGFTHIMTYPGHQPDQQHALDNFGTREQMLALAQWTTQDAVIDHFGIDYTMFDVNQTTVGSEIYNREISRSWRQVADRGGVTQNHHDHVHVSFNPTGSATPFGQTQEDDMFDPATDGQRLKNIEGAVQDLQNKVGAIFGAAGRAEDPAVNTVTETRLASIEKKLDDLAKRLP